MDQQKGIHLRSSSSSVKDTMDLLAKSLVEHGAKIYLRIDQQAEALKAGILIGPLEYLLFGNPEKGTQLIILNPIIALDLPLKIICWQDKEGATQVAFNDEAYIAGRYELPSDPRSPLNLVPLVNDILKL
ncbi:hypothetical protein GCM10023149_15970 [Mucilaginibacter gynuensis]|uniref:DUF302 domain-containing protein n=1 Tax=Mucilaginibacter gynuensis TaxID=1302236 RepID=A0ABP8G620_9SPHI